MKRLSSAEYPSGTSQRRPMNALLSSLVHVFAPPAATGVMESSPAARIMKCRIEIVHQDRTTKYAKNTKEDNRKSKILGRRHRGNAKKKRKIRIRIRIKKRIRIARGF